jgi:hypothetical protein
VAPGCARYGLTCDQGFADNLSDCDCSAAPAASRSIRINLMGFDSQFFFDPETIGP